MNKEKVEVAVEPKDQPAYVDLPEAARNAMADALLVLIQRGRLVLAEQVKTQIDHPLEPRKVDYE